MKQLICLLAQGKKGEIIKATCNREGEYFLYIPQYAHSIKLQKHQSSAYLKTANRSILPIHHDRHDQMYAAAHSCP